jgi:hypothetical protein
MKKKTPKEDEYVYSAYNRERALRERGLLPPEEVNEVKGEEGDGVMTEAKRIKEEWKSKMGEENPVSCECNNGLGVKAPLTVGTRIDSLLFLAHSLAICTAFPLTYHLFLAVFQSWHRMFTYPVHHLHPPSENKLEPITCHFTQVILATQRRSDWPRIHMVSK